MAVAKISDLTATTAPAKADVMEIEVVASPASRKVTLQNAVAACTAEAAKAGSVLRVPAIADLAQTTSNPPTQAEVQAIANKVDALLAAMRTAGMLAP